MEQLFLEPQTTGREGGWHWMMQQKPHQQHQQSCCMPAVAVHQQRLPCNAQQPRPSLMSLPSCLCLMLLNTCTGARKQQRATTAARIAGSSSNSSRGSCGVPGGVCGGHPAQQGGGPVLPHLCLHHPVLPAVGLCDGDAAQTAAGELGRAAGGISRSPLVTRGMRRLGGWTTGGVVFPPQGL